MNNMHKRSIQVYYYMVQYIQSFIRKKFCIEDSRRLYYERIFGYVETLC